jgi:hypothetical protein
MRVCTCDPAALEEGKHNAVVDCREACRPWPWALAGKDSLIVYGGVGEDGKVPRTPGLDLLPPCDQHRGRGNPSET